MEINSRTYITDIFKQKEQKYYQDIENYSNDIIMANDNNLIIDDLLSKKSYSLIELTSELEDERNVFEKEIDNPFYYEDGNKLPRVVRFILKTGVEYSFDFPEVSRKKNGNDKVLFSRENVV